MAQKSQEKGVTGPAPVVDEPGRVRNVVLVGHSGAGKTTLVEALLAASGFTHIRVEMQGAKSGPAGFCALGQREGD